MSDIISAITIIIQAIFTGTSGTSTTPSWVSSVVGTITGNPLILLAAIIPLTGLAVGMLKRLLSARV